ncbi:hypothetical protein M2437_000964 [Methylorubrum pseudosasae]|nr:hypothetical protein [Methylorubrum pseudosasae]
MRRGGAYLDIVVSDDGIGITEADLPRLGDPFFQVGGGYGRSHEGTGLGLSVVRGLAGLHGGAVSVESAPRQGHRRHRDPAARLQPRQNRYGRCAGRFRQRCEGCRRAGPAGADPDFGAGRGDAGASP